MATKPAATPAPIDEVDMTPPPVESPPPEPRAGAPISSYRVVWVIKQGVPLAKGRTGYVRVLKADAQTMLDNGDAQDPYGKTPLLNIRGANVYGPAVTLALTGFTAAGPTVASASAADVAKVKNGDRIKITQTAGTNLAALNGKTGTVFAKQVGSFTLTGIDLTGADVTGVTATGTLTLVV